MAPWTPDLHPGHLSGGALQPLLANSRRALSSPSYERQEDLVYDLKKGRVWYGRLSDYQIVTH